MQALLNTLKTGRSRLITISVAVGVFALAVWLPNLRLLAIVWENPATPLLDKVTLPITLLSAITTNFTLFSAVYTVVIAILAGVNTALIVQMIRARRVETSGVMMGVSGVAAGAFGLGCAACGSLILTALVGTTAGVGALSLLPLGGSEFGLIGVGLLSYSTYLLSKQINKTTCEIV